MISSEDKICGSKHFGPGGGMSLPEICGAEQLSTCEGMAAIMKRNDLVEQSTFIRDDEESRNMLLQKKIDQLTNELLRKETVIQYEQDKNEWYRRVLDYESQTHKVGTMPPYIKVKSNEFMGSPNKE